MATKRRAIEQAAGSCICRFATNPLTPTIECAYHQRMREALAEKSAEAKRLRNAIRWALGETGDFPVRQAGDGTYWWRIRLGKMFNEAIRHAD